MKTFILQYFWILEGAINVVSIMTFDSFHSLAKIFSNLQKEKGELYGKMSSKGLLYLKYHAGIISKSVRSIHQNVLLIFYLHSYLISLASQELKSLLQE